MKNFNAVSHNCAWPYFRIQHDRGEVRARRVYLNVHSVTGNVVGVVGYDVKIFLPSPPNYVTRSPGCNVKV